MLFTASAAVSLLGSSMLLLPLSLLLAFLLWRHRAVSLAVRWLATLAITLGAMVALKLYGHACGLPAILERVTSPSGHAAFSAFFYGSIALIVARATPAGWRQAVILVSAAGLIAAIALSRVVLHAHSRLEVLIGLAVGATAALAFAAGALAHPPVRLRLNAPAAAAILACGLAIFSAGDPGIAENVIRSLAARLHQEALLCPAEPQGLADSGPAAVLR